MQKLSERKNFLMKDIVYFYFFIFIKLDLYNDKHYINNEDGINFFIQN